MPKKPEQESSALPKLTSTLPGLNKIELDTLALPNGYKLDPESWGIDVNFEMPESDGSNFAVDLEDDEPIHVVELPAELRQFMNTQTASEMSPEQMKELITSVLIEHLPPVSTEPQKIIVERTIEQREIEVRPEMPDGVKLLRYATYLVGLIWFFWDWKSGLVLLLALWFMWTLFLLFWVNRTATKWVVSKARNRAVEREEPHEYREYYDG